jgi:hypothetical protein
VMLVLLPFVVRSSPCCSTTMKTWTTTILACDRFAGKIDCCTCLTYVDGTDCPLWEPPKTDNSSLPFDKKWYSHKLHGAGSWYKIAPCIKTGDIIYVNGPFPCGKCALCWKAVESVVW